MTQRLTLSLMTALLALAGCTAETTAGAPDGRVVALTTGPIEECDDIREVCIPTDPMECFTYCNDEPPAECEPLACPAIYPVPSWCEEDTCAELPPVDCTTAVEFDADGETLIGCVEPSPPGMGGGDDGCDYVCAAIYPSTCGWVCGGGGDDGPVGPPCAVVHTPDGDEITDCFAPPAPSDPMEPGEPVEPDPDCAEFCTQIFPSSCYSLCPGDDGMDDCADGVSYEGEYCPDESGCVSVVDEDGTVTELCPPVTSSPPSEPAEPPMGSSES